MLEHVDLTLELDKDEYEQELHELQVKLRSRQIELAERKRPIIIVYEGWDAGGKGGNIARLTERLDPRFFTVYGIGKPTQEELDHHYLWRFWTKLPARDHLVILDRSWYGRVLVERVEGFATEPEWRRAYGEINDFEKLLSDDGTIIIKFWLHISADEQLVRFESRLQDPAKRWKMNDEDWRNRAKWPQNTRLRSRTCCENKHRGRAVGRGRRQRQALGAHQSVAHGCRAFWRGFGH